MEANQYPSLPNTSVPDGKLCHWQPLLLSREGGKICRFITWMSKTQISPNIESLLEDSQDKLGDFGVSGYPRGPILKCFYLGVHSLDVQITAGLVMESQRKLLCECGLSALFIAF